MINVLINLLTHVNDGALILNARDHAAKGYEIICEAMSKWVLTAHIGKMGRDLKQKLYFFLSASTLKSWRS